MKYQYLGTSRLNASVIGMGAWAIGGGASWGNQVDDDEAMRTIEMAFDSGINFFDTAPAYGWGHSERLLGRVIQGRRDQLSFRKGISAPMRTGIRGICPRTADG
jgi:aryl-alcohol dehydrogenase-like predicted oxidoreductase